MVRPSSLSGFVNGGCQRTANGFIRNYLLLSRLAQGDSVCFCLAFDQQRADHFRLAVYRGRRTRILLLVLATILIVAALATLALFLRQKERLGTQTAVLDLRRGSIEACRYQINCRVPASEATSCDSAKTCTARRYLCGRYRPRTGLSFCFPSLCNSRPNTPFNHSGELCVVLTSSPAMNRATSRCPLPLGVLS